MFQMATFDSNIKNPIYIKNKENYHNLEVIFLGIKLKNSLDIILSTEIKTIKQKNYNNLYSDFINNYGNQNKLIFFLFDILLLIIHKIY